MVSAVGNIYIYVKDTSGNPIIGAYVTFDSPYGVTRQTDPEGKAIFYDVYAGTYFLGVQAAGYVLYQGKVTVAEGQQIFTVTLPSLEPSPPTEPQPPSNGTTPPTQPPPQNDLAKIVPFIIMLIILFAVLAFAASRKKRGRPRRGS
jgi:hypothetical protein